MVRLDYRTSASHPHTLQLVISTTQSPTDSQRAVAEALGVPFNRIKVKAKRLGGGFGGKETRNSPYAAVAAVCAAITRKPVRLVCDRDVGASCRRNNRRVVS